MQRTHLPVQTHVRPLPPLPTRPQRYDSRASSPDTVAASGSAASTPNQKRDRGRPLDRASDSVASVASSTTAGGVGSEAVSRDASGTDDAADHQDKPSAKKVKVGARASIACKTCRKRKVRCTSEWPVCTFCAARSFNCVYEGHPLENAPPPNEVGPGIHHQATHSEPILPPVHMILAALDPFFIHNYDTFYFLHRATLSEQIRTGTAPKELICCILAFAARFSQALRDLHPSSPTAASEHYAALAAQALANPPAPDESSSSSPSSDPEVTLTRCQCFLILGLWECTEGAENKGWMRIGYAIRMAQILRLAFEDEDEPFPAHGSSPSSPPQPRGDPIQSEIRRRTFWSCFLLDRTITDGKERPCTLRPPVSSTLRMPCVDTDFVSGRCGRGAKFEADIAPWNLSSRSDPRNGMFAESETDLYGHTLRIAEIWNQVVTYVGSGGRNLDRRAPWLPESTFATLDRAVRTWETRLPGVFRYNEANLVAHSMIGQGRLFGMLHLLYACSNLVLHRDYLPFLPPVDYQVSNGPSDGEPIYGQPFAPPGWWETSLTQAIDAAGVISDLSTSLTQHGSQITHPFAGFAAVAAATMHAHLKYWPQSCRTKHVNSAFYFEQDMAILVSLRNIYPIATNWCEGVAKLNILYSNVVRGVLELDPSKVRAGVIKLLRTAADDESASPRQHSVTSRPSTSSGLSSDLSTGLPSTSTAGMFGAAPFQPLPSADLSLDAYAVDLSLDSIDWASWGDFSSWPAFTTGGGGVWS